VEPNKQVEASSLNTLEYNCQVAVHVRCQLHYSNSYG